MSEDQSKEIRDMLDNIEAGKASEVQTQFNDLMYGKTAAALDAQQKVQAADVFNQGHHPQSVDPTGIPADGDPLELVDIDMDTGRPVEEPEQPEAVEEPTDGEGNEDI